jgi:hypothetical protein
VLAGAGVDDRGASGCVAGAGADECAPVERVVATPATPAEWDDDRPDGLAVRLPECAADAELDVSTGLARSCTGSATSPTVYGCCWRNSTMTIAMTTKPSTMLTPMSACWRCSGLGPALRRRWADGDIAGQL